MIILVHWISKESPIWGEGRLDNLNSLYQKLLCQVKLARRFWRKRVPLFQQIWTPLSKDALRQIWLKLVSYFWKHCHHVSFMLPWIFIWKQNRGIELWLFMSTNLNPLNKTMCCVQFGLKQHRCFWEFVNVKMLDRKINRQTERRRTTGYRIQLGSLELSA